jgi:Domain of unknown function (DUF5017)
MKNILKTGLLLSFSLALLTSCVNDDETAIPSLKIPFYTENFDEVDFNEVLDYENWTNFAEAGTKFWIEREFNDDGYAQFSSFQSGNSSNIGWLISPPIDLTDKIDVKMSFQSASNFVENSANKLEVFVSSNYDGTNVLGATWTKMNANVADETTNDYLYVPSGEIDLSAYTSQIHIAFKATGSNTLSGLFQVDKLNVYTSK